MWKTCANITLEFEGEKCFKTYFNVLERQYTKSLNFTDDKKTNYSSNTNDILESAKNFYEKIYTKAKQSPSRKKISNEQFHFFEAEISLKPELLPNLLVVFHSWDKLDTIGVSSRTGVIPVIYKKGDEKDSPK